MAGDKAVLILFVGRLSADLWLSGDAADGCGDDDDWLSTRNRASLASLQGSLTGWKYVFSSEFSFRSVLEGDGSPLPSWKHSSSV